MRTATALATFDEQAIFVVDETALVTIPSNQLSEVPGGADIVCDNNGVCATQINAGLCANIACSRTLTDAVCIDNVVC